MNELLGLIVKNLNLDESQAKGALGAVLGFAEKSLSGTDFSKISGLIGGAENLMKSAPEVGGGLMGMVGTITSALGMKNEGIGNVANLMAAFNKLNIDPATIQKFVPIVTSFLKDKGGSEVSSIVETMFKNVLK